VFGWWLWHDRSDPATLAKHYGLFHADRCNLYKEELCSQKILI